MQIVLLEAEEMDILIDQTHNPPAIESPVDEAAFAEEIQGVYEGIVDALSVYGEEGDFYGQSDFALRPSLSGRVKPSPGAIPRTRQLTVTILSERFLRSGYLSTLRRFLCRNAPDYRVWIDQDIHPSWIETIILTCDSARIYCTNPDESARLCEVLDKL